MDKITITRTCSVVGFGKESKEPWCSVKRIKFLESLVDCQPTDEASVPWTWSVSLGFGKQHQYVNPLNAELNPICYLLALLAHHFLHLSRIRVKSLTLRLLMSYIYMEHPFLMFLDHTQRRSTVGRTPLDE